jgi:predicted GNAT family N-acyltransferase
MRIRHASWDDPRDRQVLVRIRRIVYIEEQQVLEREEFEGLDPACPHFIAEVQPNETGPPEAVGVARLRYLDDGTPKAERFAVLPEHRGQGIGRALVRVVEDEARRRGAREIVLAAQIRAESFYAQLGYEAYGDRFEEAGITHTMMRKQLT